MLAKEHTVFRLIRNWLSERVDKLVLWCTSVSFSFMIGVFLSFFARSRMSHNNGIGATGRLQVVDDPTFPAHSFFPPGKQFPARIRHASVTFLDDAMNCLRSLSIKLSEHHFDSPFDLEMNTGERSLFWSAASFIQFAKMRKEKYGVQYVEYVRKYPTALRASQLMLRRHVTSFQNLRYYNKTPFLFVGNDGIRRYAKYRALPFDGAPESGIDPNPSDWDVANQRILPHESRGRNFLKDEYARRIPREGAKYKLQIQLHTASCDDDPEVFNNMVPWDERTHPWHDLAVMDIDQVLDWKESTLTSFSLNNMPKSLGILPAKSIYDYNSLNYMRSHSEFARRMRLMSYKVFGMVPPVPDNDRRNESEWGV